MRISRDAAEKLYYYYYYCVTDTIILAGLNCYNTYGIFENVYKLLKIML